MFTPSRQQVRHFFMATWQKMHDSSILIGAEKYAAQIIAEHSEYHSILANPHSATQEWDVSGGQINPFLHLSLHLAVAEQLSINQPTGIAAAFAQLLKTKQQHDAEHVLIDCLGETIWNLSQNQPSSLPTSNKNSTGTEAALAGRLNSYLELVRHTINFSSND